MIEAPAKAGLIVPETVSLLLTVPLPGQLSEIRVAIGATENRIARDAAFACLASPYQTV